MKSEIKVKMGKKSKAQGNAFEKRVRLDLEEKGFIVDKWTNNVEVYDMHTIHTYKAEGDKLIEHVDKPHGKLVKAKNKWAGPNRPMMMGAGFPDFVCWHKDINKEVEKRIKGEESNCVGTFGVESKLTGELDRPEKDKCKWLLENGIFSKILIAKKTKVKNKIVVVYEDFKEKYWRFYK